MGMIPRSDVSFTTHAHVQPGPKPTMALAFWKVGPFHHHCYVLKNEQKVGGGGDTEQKGQELSVPFPKVSP
jgi:hypothetical protein